MGRKFTQWKPRSEKRPESFPELASILLENRSFEPLSKLEYGDHGMDKALQSIGSAIEQKKRIALYADYDVDGTMSCVSWIWFLQAIGFSNFIHYIPCRFKEGYGVNLKAIQHLIENEHAEVIITMDTGITANEEAAYCRDRGIEFICTDHHKIQPEKMPDCIILNPKAHPDPRYQELCGCGITFVLLRRLSERFPLPDEVWTDLLALVGMATICDVVPLNCVNHRLARQGVAALMRSRRPVLKGLREAGSLIKDIDEKDLGFRLGPRINAVGRLGHADQVIEAFIGDDPTTLIQYMGTCNDRRKQIQKDIVNEARLAAQKVASDPILFLGGDWHAGVVGIAASKIAEEFWRPTWLFQRKDGVCKGSARSINGFDVTLAMQLNGEGFTKFGGHRAAAGFSFPVEKENEIRERLIAYGKSQRESSPSTWESLIQFDCDLPMSLAEISLTEHLDELKPFGHGFEEPRFRLDTKILGTQFYCDKDTGERKHTAVKIPGPRGRTQKIMFFNEVHPELEKCERAKFVVSASRNTFQGNVSLSLTGFDFEVMETDLRL